MRPNKSGFSLLELLLAVSLLPVLSFVLYGQISAGLRLWKTLEASPVSEEKALFYEKTRRDFSNALNYTGLHFSVDSSRVAFTTLGESSELFGGDRAVLRVTYDHDASRKTIVRRHQNLSQVHRDKPGEESVVLKNVRSLNTSFLLYEKLSEAYVWKDSWDNAETKTLPNAVRFQMQLEGPAGLETWTKTYPIPASKHEK